MEDLFARFHSAYSSHNGYALSQTILPTFAPRLRELTRSTSPATLVNDLRQKTIYDPSFPTFSKLETTAWLDVYIAYFRCIFSLVEAEQLTANKRGGEAQWGEVYERWKDVVNALIKGYSGSHFNAWTVPLLYVAGKWARAFATRADEAAALYGGASPTKGQLDEYGEEDVMAAGTEETGLHDNLEDAARLINRIFGLCIGDRAPIEDSRKWALYSIANLLFKVHFKLNALSLSKNILHSLRATTSDMPPLSAFPRAHVVTFHYYVGVLCFLDEDYTAADEQLTSALSGCPRPLASQNGARGFDGGARNGFAASKAADRNRERILTYLIPTRLLTSRLLPSATLLAPYPALQRLFGPLCAHIKRGDLAGFDAALEEGAEVFVRKRVYLTLERGRDVAVRNLFRKVFLAGGWEDGVNGKRVRRTRVPVEEFRAALNMGLGEGRMYGAVKDQDQDDVVDREEAECCIANLVYKNLMKGYISREKAMVVLSKHEAGAFPGTGI